MKKNFFTLLLFVLAKFSFSQTYTPGVYYTQDGQRVEGLIQHAFFAKIGQGPDNYINFKETADAKRIKLTTKEVRSFTINADSFIIIKDFTISTDVHYKEDFAKIAVLGKLNLYLHYTTGMNGMNSFDAATPILEKDGKLIALTNRIFKSNYEEFFAGDDELIKKIKSKELTFNDVVAIVIEYNN